MMSCHPWNQALWDRLTADVSQLPHGILLHGPAGVGKRSLALALAKRMLCSQPTPEGACGQCPSCSWFDQGAHPDFRLIEPAEPDAGEEGAGKKGGRHIAIQEIRGLAEFLALAPHQGGWRTVVVHPAEAMNVPAANALLKTLEEPPSRVLIILVSHQPRRLLPTVLSRCRKVAVTLPDTESALAWLGSQGLASAEMLLREAGGAPLKALDCADPERLARRERFLEALSRPSPAGLSVLAQDFQNRLDEAWGWFSRWVHDLMRVKLGSQARYFKERHVELDRQAGALPLEGLMALEEEVRRAGRWLKHPLNSQLLLESWLLRYADLLEDSHGR